MVEVVLLFTKNALSWFITENGKDIFICEKQIYKNCSQKHQDILRNVLKNHKFYEQYDERFHLVEHDLIE